MKLSCWAVVAIGVACVSASAAEVHHRIGVDVACDFSSVGCDADARLYKTGSAGDQALQPIWDGNRLAIFCKGVEAYSGDATVVRGSSPDGILWTIQSGDESALIELDDRTFDRNSNPKQVSAILEFSHGGRASGICRISRTQ